LLYIFVIIIFPIYDNINPNKLAGVVIIKPFNKIKEIINIYISKKEEKKKI
jgi:hypothetical protein